MSVIQSKIDPRSENFAANDSAMRALIDELHANVDRVAEGGGTARAARHKSRGKLLARERIARLLDQGAPFLEIGQFAAWEMYTGDVMSAGVIAGIGRIAGVECMIVANDPTVKAFARAGNRARKPPAVYLSCRVGRRVPADAG